MAHECVCWTTGACEVDCKHEYNGVGFLPLHNIIINNKLNDIVVSLFFLFLMKIRF